MELNEKQMMVTDDAGNDHLVNILFTYTNEERETSYVVFYEEGNPEELIAMKYNEETKELSDIEDDEEFNEVQEVLDAFLEQSEPEEEQ